MVLNILAWIVIAYFVWFACLLMWYLKELIVIGVFYCGMIVSLLWAISRVKGIV